MNNTQPTIEQQIAYIDRMIDGAARGLFEVFPDHLPKLGGIRATLSAASTVPDGYVIVPIEPTEYMLQAAKFRHNSTPHIDYMLVYQDMIAAAPPAPQPTVSAGEDHDD